MSGSCGGEGSRVDRAAGARPINALAAMTLVLAHPQRTFERLTERPHWVLPLVFVVAAPMVSAVYAVRSGFMDELVPAEAALAGGGLAGVRAALLSQAILMAVVGIPLVILLETLLFRLAGTLAGGRASFGVVFSAVAHASIPVGIGALVLGCFLRFTGTARAGLNLGFLIEPVRHPHLWSILRQIDLFSVWLFALLGIAAEPVFGLPRRRARAATVAFALAYILIMSWSGRGAVGPGM